MAYNFDPNEEHHLTGQVTLACWEYRLVIKRPVTRRFGKGGVDWVEWFLEDFYQEVGGAIMLENAAGETLLCEDDDDEGSEFLLSMVIEARLLLPGEASN